MMTPATTKIDDVAPAPLRELGVIYTEGKGTNWKLRCDALAAMGNSLLVVSAIGPSTSVKALAATLNSNARITIRSEFGSTFRSHLLLDRMECGYRIQKHRVAGNYWHILAVSKMPQLLTECSEQSVWRRLRSTDYTTPILREWMPYLIDKLREYNQLREPSAVGCKPAILAVSTTNLDRLVSEGVKAGDLRIK